MPGVFGFFQRVFGTGGNAAADRPPPSICNPGLDELPDLLRETPPSCLEGFTARPAEARPASDDCLQTAWSLACACGGEGGRFLGHPLPADPAVMISPLGFQCGRCDATTELLDTDVHGYHPEITRLAGEEGGSAKLRGAGPRTALRCASCAGDQFTLTVSFDYWSLDELAEEFDEDLQNLFNVFGCECRCVGCGAVARPTSFGKL